MDKKFRQQIEQLHPAFELLIKSEPFKFSSMPKDLPSAGIYLFTKNGKHLYVGRANNIRRRLQDHCRPGSKQNQATFAFLLARKKTGRLRATYKPEGSRAHLMQDAEFVQAFSDAKARLRAMQIRTVSEADPLRQALLEMYVHICLGTPHNDFDNH
jgi:predicted GIY-YIG superfamily endonuclease